MKTGERSEEDAHRFGTKLLAQPQCLSYLDDTLAREVSVPRQKPEISLPRRGFHAADDKQIRKSAHKEVYANPNKRKIEGMCLLYDESCH